MIYATVSYKLSKHTESLDRILVSMALRAGGVRTGSGAGSSSRDISFMFESDASAHRFKAQIETIAASADARPVYGSLRLIFHPHASPEDLGQLQKKAEGRHQLVLVELPLSPALYKSYIKNTHSVIDMAGRYASMDLIGRLDDDQETLAFKANSQDAELYVQALTSVLSSAKAAIIDAGPLRAKKPLGKDTK